MSFQELRGYIIYKEPSASNSTISRASILTPEYGVLSFLARESKSSKLATTLDLFDYGTAIIKDSRPGREFLFLQEFRLEKRNNTISNNYTAFRYACSIAKILHKNKFHVDSSHDFFDLWERSIHHLSNNKSPEVVYLKALYLLTQQEGYAVKESWLRQLPKQQKEITTNILKSAIGETPNVDDVKESIEHLQQWIRRETPIML